MTQLNDFYQTVYELRDNLKTADQIDWSTRVDGTLYGSTSGEILENRSKNHATSWVAVENC